MILRSEIVVRSGEKKIFVLELKSSKIEKLQKYQKMTIAFNSSRNEINQEENVRINM